MTRPTRIAELLRGPTAGFDWLRLVLALWVIAYHSSALTSVFGHDLALRVESGGYRILSSVAVPGFFAVSGFLVSASADRNRPGAYAAFRALRLLPALGVVTLLTMFVVGPLVTTLPLRAYFTNPLTWAQLSNLTGVTQTELPGFQGLAVTSFNGSLWSIPWEVACYVGLGLLAWRGVVRRPVLMVAIWTALFANSLVGDWIIERNAAYDYYRHAVRSGELLSAFSLGAAIYACRNYLVASRLAGLVAFTLALLLLWLGAWPALAMLPLTYGLVAIGLGSAPRLQWDVSYGVYIAAFPIQQMLSLTAWGSHWWVNGPTAAALAILYGTLSWKFIEAPCLALKPRVYGLLSATSVGRKPKEARALAGQE